MKIKMKLIIAKAYIFEVNRCEMMFDLYFYELSIFFLT